MGEKESGPEGRGSEETHEGGSPRQGEQSDGRPNLTDLYEKMSGMFRENLERAGNMSEEAFERALKDTREWADKLRESYGDDVSRVTDYIRRDWHEAIRFTRDQTRKSFDLERLQVGVLDVLFMLAKSAGSQLASFAKRIDERLTYKTGEITGAGTLECTQCRQHLTFSKATRIPPCPKCRNTHYRRSY